MYLVDTNVLSEARRGSNEARTWLRSVDPSTIYFSVVTLGEIMKGIALKRRTDARTAASLTMWLEQLRHDHSERILPISDRVALEWGRLAAGAAAFYSGRADRSDCRYSQQDHRHAQCRPFRGQPDSGHQSLGIIVNEIKPIRSEADYEAALAEVDRL